MNRKHKTYWEAAFLLLVFSLNTVLGFACSLSAVFHDLHHRSVPTATRDHQHGAIAGHHHNHQHNKGAHDQGGHASKKSEDNDCCSGSIVLLEKVDKSVASQIKAPMPPLESPLIESWYLMPGVQQAPELTFPAHSRWRPPGTIQQLRILIQSFQI